MFSKSCEYGIKAAIHIGQHSLKGERVGLKAIADAIDSPTAFTAKILQILSKEGLIVSTKGPTGGYEINTSNEDKITLLHIVNAIDGEAIYNGCGLGLKQCKPSEPCPLHQHFVAIRTELKTMLKTTTIEELGNGLYEGVNFLKR